MRVYVDAAIRVAKESKMEKKMGSVIVHKNRIVAESANYTVGTMAFCNNRAVYNASMHSEMGAIEQLAKDMGCLQTLHRLLSGVLLQPKGRRFEPQM